MNIKNFTVRIKNGFVSSATKTFHCVQNHWRGFLILCMATIGATNVFIATGISSSWALAGASVGVWSLTA